jgi:hypothetical protein
MYGSYKFVFRRDCALEAMRTQGAFSLFQGVAEKPYLSTSAAKDSAGGRS